MSTQPFHFLRTLLESRVRAGCQVLLLAGAVLAGSAGCLHAGIVPVGSGPALGANHFVDWAQLGPANTTLPNSNNFTSDLGLMGSIVDGTGPRLANNPAVFGTGLAYDNQFGGPVTVNFNLPVLGVGVRAFNNFGTILPFFYHVQVFNSGGSLGTFDFASPQANNVPTFVAVLDTLPEITKVIYTVDATPSNSGNNFVLSGLSLKVPSSQSSVPEPSSFVLMGTALAAALWWRLRPAYKQF